MLRGAGISTHVPRTGHDNMEDATWFHTHIFQSTRPLRGATSANGKKLAELMVFQSTRPLRGATLKARKPMRDVLFQSTCPVRGTTRLVPDLGQVAVISIHVPRTGHDGTGGVHVRHIAGFQSTCPVRGTTAAVRSFRLLRPYFNPRAPYGARQQKCTNSILHFCNNRQ